jgi:hypothetical protein
MMAASAPAKAPTFLGIISQEKDLILESMSVQQTQWADLLEEMTRRQKEWSLSQEQLQGCLDVEKAYPGKSHPRTIDPSFLQPLSISNPDELDSRLTAQRQRRHTAKAVYTPPVESPKQPDKVYESGWGLFLGSAAPQAV